ncbi:MAG: hypothetical protein EZS28_029019 [Streblomastix strix]|uniref:Uncharacterized protein n=1 Tax=Streblomastix strix TaxID=222440 RepID=A0A5J4UZ23_9EUKA|nr:MAG: hypothetical protein EZS28_029019 [Streblomastix strix]
MSSLLYQKCITDLSHQTAANCPCLSTGDPRAGNGQCPAYCIGPNTPSGCVCDTNPHAYYPPQTCKSDKKCTEPSSSTVQTDSCTCSSTNYPTGCKCPANSTELTGIPQSRCECRNTGDPRAGKGECPEYCVKDSLTQQCVCDTGSQSYPSATCEKDKKCKFELATQTNVTCPCLSTGDPRAGKGQCPAYCVAKDQPNVNCVCDSNPSAQYPPSTCNSEKKCTAYSDQTVPTNSCTCSSSNHPTGCKCPTETSQLIGIPKTRCECLSTGDPRAGNGQCPKYCVKGSITSYCFCDTELSDYPQAQCIQDQKSKFELINRKSTYCQCLSAGDPRAGKGQCPAYCTSKDQPNKDCACDIGSTSYPPSQCQQEKQCTASSSSQVPTDSCTCIESNYPQGCKCPNDPQYLVGISKERCECRTTEDPRANGICPAYCIKDSLISDCECDTGSYQYPSATCTKDKACKFELINQTNTTCPCLSTVDPRDGKGQCPAYCLKGQLIQNCACDSDSITYPSQTCQIDKLCQFNLINQTQEICECLQKSDPRAGDVCPPYCVKGQLSSDCLMIQEMKQFVIKEVVDPPITDPDPSDTKPDDEQQDGPKQEQKKTEEESSSANLIMIISITVGIKKEEEFFQEEEQSLRNIIGDIKQSY